MLPLLSQLSAPPPLPHPPRQPYRVAYPWRSTSRVKNDFFMYGTPDCLAVGGLGHFAIWVDSELLNGSSGTCGTFGSPCLAQGNEFRIQFLEVRPGTAWRNVVLYTYGYGGKLCRCTQHDCPLLCLGLCEWGGPS